MDDTKFVQLVRDSFKFLADDLHFGYVGYESISGMLSIKYARNDVDAVVLLESPGNQLHFEVRSKDGSRSQSVARLLRKAGYGGGRWQPWCVTADDQWEPAVNDLANQVRKCTPVLKRSINL